MSRLWIVLLLGGCMTESPPVPGQDRPPRAKAGKQPQAGNKRLPPTARQPAKAPSKPIGIAGALTGELVLTPPEGAAKKTKAELSLTWQGGAAKPMLGLAPGTCEAGEPQPLADGVALWWATCTHDEAVADFAVMQVGGNLVVRRAKRVETGKPDWVEVRKLPLAEGAVLQAKTE
jgi:hypothetical protein